MSRDDLPVIKLNERSLQRLHEKFKKLQAESQSSPSEAKNARPVQQKVAEKSQNQQQKAPERKPKRAPKFEVYRAGVSRLSSREPTIKKDPDTIRNKKYVDTQSTKQDADTMRTKQDVDAMRTKQDVDAMRTKQDVDAIRNKKDAAINRKEKDADKIMKKDADGDTKSSANKGRTKQQTKSKQSPKRNAREKPTKKTEGARKKSDHIDITKNHKFETESENELEWDNYNHSRFIQRRESPPDKDYSLEPEEQPLGDQKQLFDPSNPQTPIVVSSTRRNGRFHSIATSNQYDHTEDEVDGLGTNMSYRHDEDDFMSTNRQHRVVPLYDQYQETYHTSGYHQSVTPERMTGVRLMSEVERNESFIKTSLSSADFTSTQFIENLQKSRHFLMDKYKSLILSDISTAVKNNTEQTLWKNIFHQVIEKLREHISIEDDPPTLKALLVSILDQASEFYEGLLFNLQRAYHFDLKEILSSLAAAKTVMKRAGKKTKLGIMCCQKCLLCLGDIARYKENTGGTLNYGRARKFYVQARCVDARNGRPYNQLAVLAVHTRRRLDAIYYYIRSLATTGSPILTARESLASLFSEAHRKLEIIQSSEKKALSPESRNEKKDFPKVKSETKELWIFPNCSIESTKADPIEEVESKKISPHHDHLKPSEMVKKFILMFLNVHGKLFTKVGYDSFTEARNNALQLFLSVLNRASSHVTETMMLHIFAVNFFSVHDQVKRSTSDDKGATSLLQPALEFALAMTSSLVTRINEVTSRGAALVGLLQVKELQVLLPVLKLCSDWMLANRDLWYPRPPAREKSDKLDIWTNLAHMCDWLCDDQLTFPMQVFSAFDHDCTEIDLPEDHEFAGFVPLLKYDLEPKFVLDCDLEHSHVLALQCVRLTLIQDFLGYLCGMERPLLAFKNGRYVALVDSGEQDESVAINHEVDAHLINDDSGANFLPDNHNPHLPLGGDVTDLQALHVTLQRTKIAQERRRSRIQASLNANEAVENKVVRIQPNFVVPDTNCFIDHLQLIANLLDYNQFFICVPLVVVSELEGISQDSRGNDSHSTRVRRDALEASAFLKRKFEHLRDTRLLALTNQGNPLATISFRTQQHSSDKGTNDDMILQCCTKLSENNQKSTKSLTKTVVLLTDDRNLRIKAMSQSLPTLAISEFSKMAKVT